MLFPKYYMKSLEVVESLRHMPCQDNNPMVLIGTAYDHVCAEPLSSISVLAGRVATAATQRGLVLAAPAGSFTLQQLQNVQQQIQQQPYVNQRPTQRPPPPPRHCWRCGGSGHMAGTCTAAVNPGNPYPFKPQRA
jgi:hypothetical protein